MKRKDVLKLFIGVSVVGILALYLYNKHNKEEYGFTSEELETEDLVVYDKSFYEEGYGVQ